MLGLSTLILLVTAEWGALEYHSTNNYSISSKQYSTSSSSSEVFYFEFGRTKLCFRRSNFRIAVPHSGHKPLKLQVVCPKNGTAVLKGLMKVVGKSPSVVSSIRNTDQSLRRISYTADIFHFVWENNHIQSGLYFVLLILILQWMGGRYGHPV